MIEPVDSWMCLKAGVGKADAFTGRDMVFCAGAPVSLMFHCSSLQHVVVVVNRMQREDFKTKETLITGIKALMDGSKRCWSSELRLRTEHDSEAIQVCK